MSVVAKNRLNHVLMKNKAQLALFGLRLHRMRIEKNLNLQALADLADSTKISIQRIRNITVAVKLDTLMDFATA